MTDELAARRAARQHPTCPVTVWDTIPPVPNGGRGERVINARRCGEPVDRLGLCAQHAADKERLT